MSDSEPESEKPFQPDGLLQEVLAACVSLPSTKNQKNAQEKIRKDKGKHMTTGITIPNVKPSVPRKPRTSKRTKSQEKYEAQTTPKRAKRAATPKSQEK